MLHYLLVKILLQYDDNLKSSKTYSNSTCSCTGGISMGLYNALRFHALALCSTIGTIKSS